MKVIPVAEMNFMLQSNKIEFLVVGRRGRAGICRRYPIDQSVVFLINDIKMLVMSAFLCQVAQPQPRLPRVWGL